MLSSPRMTLNVDSRSADAAVIASSGSSEMFDAARSNERSTVIMS